MMNGSENAGFAQHWERGRYLPPDMHLVRQTGFDTLDKSLWRLLLSSKDANDPESALERQALLAPDEAGELRATIAGILLCTRNPERFLPHARITAVHYRGEDRASGQFDAQEIIGPLDQQIREAVAFVKRNMRVAARKDPARVDIPQYSLKAVFEAVVNAVAHRDYAMRQSKIRLSMFADRLELQSPGALPNNMKLENMGHRLSARNEVLVSALGRMRVRGTPGSEDRLYFMGHHGDGFRIITRETQELCGKPPVYRLLDDSEVRLAFPTAPQDPSPARVIVTVYSEDTPLEDVDVLALFPNKEWRRTTTDEHGEAYLDLHTTELPMTVFAAALNFAACVEHDWMPSQRPLALQMKEFPSGNSTIFTEETGALPGLVGQLRFIQDDLGRTCLYAYGILINEGQEQPVRFFLGDELRLTDVNGRELLVRFVDITGKSALVEYFMPPKHDFI